MTVEEVKTRFVADIAKYKKDIQDAQKVLQGFIKASDTSMNKKQSAEFSLQKSIQKTAQEQAKALQQELKLGQQTERTKQKNITAQDRQTRSYQNFGTELIRTARNIATLYYSAKAVAAVFKTGIDFNRFSESAEASFRVMQKSGEAAKQTMASLFEFAVDSPLTFRETVEASKQLMAYGFSVKSLIPNMKMLGTVALATGQSLGDISYVYGTLKTQGRAYSRDLMQFAMRGIPIYEELAKVMGVSVTQIQKMTAEGEVGFEQVERAFENMTSTGGRFAGMLEERMKTLDGAMAQFGDVAEQSMGILTKGMTKEATKEILLMTNAMKESKKQIEGWGAVLGVATSVISFFANGLGAGLLLLQRFTGLEALLPAAGAEIDKINKRADASKKAFEEAAKAAKAYSDAIKGLGNVEDLRSEKRDMRAGRVYEDQRAFLSGLTGETPGSFIDAEDPKGLDVYGTLGAKGANLFIAGLEEEMQKNKEVFRDIWTKDMEKDAIEKKIEEATKALVDGADVVGLFEQTNYDENLRAYIKRLQALLDEDGNKLTPKVVNKDMWFDREFMVKATEQAYDDLDLQRDKDLQSADDKYYKGEISLAQHIRAEAAMWEKYYQDLDKLRREDALKAYEVATNGSSTFWEDIKAAAGEAFSRGNSLAGAGGVITGTLQGTEVGSMMAGAHPLAIAAQAAMEFVMSIENVQKVLNPFQTFFEAMRPILEPLINGNLSSIVDTIEMLGEVVGNIIAPFVAIGQVAHALLYVSMMPLMIALQAVAGGFTWFYDEVIVPVGNGIIDIINGAIKAINKALGFLGVNIRLLERLSTMEEIMDQEAQLAYATKSLAATINYLTRKLNDEIDKQLNSLKDLYDVGAISGAQYTAQAAEINQYRVDQEEMLVSLADQQLTSLDAIHERLIELLDLQEYLDTTDDSDAQKLQALLEAGIKVFPQEGDAPVAPPASGIPEGWTGTAEEWAAFQEMIENIPDFLKGPGSFNPFGGIRLATGTPNVPMDMPANLHKGEGVIPAPFMDGIRAGELALSGGGRGATNNAPTIYQINVEGSVMAENDLLDTISRGLNRQAKRGYA